MKTQKNYQIKYKKAMIIPIMARVHENIYMHTTFYFSDLINIWLHLMQQFIPLEIRRYLKISMFVITKTCDRAKQRPSMKSTCLKYRRCASIVPLTASRNSNLFFASTLERAVTWKEAKQHSKAKVCNENF